MIVIIINKIIYFILNHIIGVGRQLKHKLSDMGYKTCESLRSMPLSNLQKHFGNKTGKFLYQYCRGIDERPLNFTIVCILPNITLQKQISHLIYF